MQLISGGDGFLNLCNYSLASLHVGPGMFDDFVKSPTFRLRRIALSACGGLSLRRTMSTPRDTRLARLEFGTFYKVVCKSTFDEPINFERAMTDHASQHPHPHA